MTEAVEELGGVVDFCAKLRVSNVSAFRWMKAGRIKDLDTALRVARLSGIPVERFSGLSGERADQPPRPSPVRRRRRETAPGT